MEASNGAGVARWAFAAAAEFTQRVFGRGRWVNRAASKRMGEFGWPS
jgi:hypothetical protein